MVADLLNLQEGLDAKCLFLLECGFLKEVTDGLLAKTALGMKNWLCGSLDPNFYILLLDSLWILILICKK